MTYVSPCPLNASCSLPNGHTACCRPVTREQYAALVRALTEIADTDFRGNRSPESWAAHQTLVREGLRS